MYKVKHIPTGLYYQPVTSSGTNLGKKGKIYETSSSCLSGSEDYIIIDIKKISPIYRDFAGILDMKYGLKKAGAKFGYVYCKIPKSDFEKEYLPVDINTLENIISKQREKYIDNDIVQTCLNEIIEQITGEKVNVKSKNNVPNMDELVKSVRELKVSKERTEGLFKNLHSMLS